MLPRRARTGAAISQCGSVVRNACRVSLRSWGRRCAGSATDCRRARRCRGRGSAPCAASPKVVLTAELADRRLATFCVEALLEVVAGERGVLDEDRFERCAPLAEIRGACPRRLEVGYGYAPDLECVSPERLPVPAGRAHSKPPKRARVRGRRCDGVSSLALGIARWHERMFAATPDGSPPEPGSREGNWGARDRTRT